MRRPYLIKRAVFSAFLFLGSSPSFSSALHAQEVEAYEALRPDQAAPEQSGGEGEKSEKPRPFSLSVDFKPAFAGNLQAARGDALRDANATATMKLNINTDIAPGLAFTGFLGAKWKSDYEFGDDEQDAASLLANAKLNWKARTDYPTLTPFLSYDLEHLTTGFFRSDPITDHVVAVGMDIVIVDCRGGGACKFPGTYKVTLIPSVNRVLSSDGTRERFTPGIKGKLEIPVSNGLRFDLSADYQYRIFDVEVDGVQRQHRLLALASVDFAEFVKERVGGLKALSSLALGASWERVSSGMGVSKSEVVFQPALSLKFVL